MTHEELTARVQVLEERLARLAGILVALLEAIADDDAKAAARKLREIIDSDLK